ncbi:MAG TPA: multiheme c-type cytochrome, partial [Planctomycetota bacterium]|nr:multiheme c-type cytochrome [Planctomycetota bacterium]
MPIEAKHIIRLSPVVLLVLAGALLWLHPFGADEESLEAVTPGREYAGSERCQTCHPHEWEVWRRSHHALAERKLDPDRDRAALLGPEGEPRVFEEGDVAVTFRDRAGRLEVVAGEPGRPGAVHYPVRVIAVEPLW